MAGAAAERVTTLWFPPMIANLLTTGDIEIGGLFLFSKERQPYEHLKCNSLMVAVGQKMEVSHASITNRFRDQNAWVLFHTHPRRALNASQQLSAGDLSFILGNAFVSRYDMPEDVPTVSHLLITDEYTLFTKVGQTPFHYQIRLMDQFKADYAAQSPTDDQIIAEYYKGISVLFNTYQTKFRSIAGKIASDRLKNPAGINPGEIDRLKELEKDPEGFIVGLYNHKPPLGDQLASIETMVVDYFLDKCQFEPKDVHTQFLLGEIPVGASMYTDWLKARVATGLASLPTKESVSTHRSDNSGLFVSWHKPYNTYTFKDAGVAITDDGKLYDFIEGWNLAQPSPALATGHLSGRETARREAEAQTITMTGGERGPDTPKIPKTTGEDPVFPSFDKILNRPSPKWGKPVFSPAEKYFTMQKIRDAMMEMLYETPAAITPGPLDTSASNAAAAAAAATEEARRRVEEAARAAKEARTPPSELNTSVSSEDAETGLTPESGFLTPPIQKKEGQSSSSSPGITSPQAVFQSPRRPKGGFTRRRKVYRKLI